MSELRISAPGSLVWKVGTFWHFKTLSLSLSLSLSLNRGFHLASNCSGSKRWIQIILQLILNSKICSPFSDPFSNSFSRDHCFTEGPIWGPNLRWQYFNFPLNHSILSEIFPLKRERIFAIVGKPKLTIFAIFVLLHFDSKSLRRSNGRSVSSDLAVASGLVSARPVQGLCRPVIYRTMCKAICRAIYSRYKRTLR